MNKVIILFLSLFCVLQVMGQNPQPQDKMKKLKGEFIFREGIIISWGREGSEAASYFKESFPNDKILAKKDYQSADVYLATDDEGKFGEDDFILEVLSTQIIITAKGEHGFKKGIDALLSICFHEENRKLALMRFKCFELKHVETPIEKKE